MHPRTPLLVPMLIVLAVSVALLLPIFLPEQWGEIVFWSVLGLLSGTGWLVALIQSIKLSLLRDECDGNACWIERLTTENALLKQERNQLLRGTKPWDKSHIESEFDKAQRRQGGGS